MLRHPSPAQLSCDPSSLEDPSMKSPQSLGPLAPWRAAPHSLLVLLPGAPRPTPLRPLLTPTPALGRRPLSSHRFLFRHWGRWMDWSLAFVLVISLLVTYASLLLVGPGGLLA